MTAGAEADRLAARQSTFVRDGVVHIPGALDAEGLAIAERAYRWSIEHPGPYAGEVLSGGAGAFFQDHANPAVFEAYRPLLLEAGLAALVAHLMGSRQLWLLYEQIWLKEGLARRATPWHQDLAYVPMAGDHLAVIWLNLDAVPQADSLMFVAGSQHGPLYNPTAFDANDPGAVMFAPDSWPRLPDIDADRRRWPIKSWAVAPGDVVVFHPGVLHGGAPTRDGVRRRTISLRLFGDRAYCDARPENGLPEIDRLNGGAEVRDPMEAMARCPSGMLFRHPGFPRLL